MRQMQGIRTWTDLQEYCESEQVHVHLLRKGYLIYTPDEIVDFASEEPLDIFKVWRILKKEVSGRWMMTDLRSSTSWRLARSLSRRNRIAIRNIEKWNWEEEEMVSCQIWIL